MSCLLGGAGFSVNYDGEPEPDGGNAGGQVVASAPPEEVVRLQTHTGKALQSVLARV